MSTIKPRVKWVADFPHARLSYAEIAAAVANEVMAGKMGDDVTVRWADGVDETAKNDLLFSVLRRDRWSMCYPGGSKTCYKFTSVKWHDDGLQEWDYMAWATLGERRDVITLTIIRLQPRSWNESRDRVIATIDLDLDYLDSLGALRYEGTDEEWDRVED